MEASGDDDDQNMAAPTLTAGRMLATMGCLAVEGECTLEAFSGAQRRLDASAVGRVRLSWRRYLRTSPAIKARISVKSHFDRVLSALPDGTKPPELSQARNGGARWPAQLDECLRRAVGSDASRAQEAAHQIQAWAAKVGKLQATTAKKARLGKQREILQKAVADPAARRCRTPSGGPWAPRSAWSTRCCRRGSRRSSDSSPSSRGSTSRWGSPSVLPTRSLSSSWGVASP